MKRILLLAAAALIALSSYAQFNNPDNHAYFGLRLSANINSPSDVSVGKISFDGFKTGPGFSFGGVYNIPVWQNLYVEPGLMLWRDTYKENVFDDDERDAKYKFKKFGISIPVMVGYRFDVFSRGGWSFFTGPELRIGLAGKETDGDGHSEDLYGDEGVANQADCAWNLGTGVNVDKFYIGFTASIGMVDMFKEQPKYRENRFCFSVGYNF